MESRSVGALVVALGLAAVVIGILIWTGALSWFGRLPGDVRVEREHVRVYVPIVSMLLLSLALTAVMYLLRRLF